MLRDAGTVDKVHIDLEVVLGKTRMPVHQMLRMGRGAVIELQTQDNEDVLVIANNVPIAVASVHVESGRIAVSITRMLPPPVSRPA